MGGFLSLSIFVYFIFYFDSGENDAVEDEIDSGENDAVEDEILYSEIAQNFFTDYDKENPVTNR